MQRFGSLHAVLEATEDELQTVEGVGPRSAELLHLCFALFHRYQADVAKMEQFTDKLNTYDRIGAYFVPQLCAEREEVLLAAYVDGAGRVLKCEEIARGGHARVQVDSYKIARGALMAGAAGVALAHNHPNSTPTPSQEDFDMTDRLRRSRTGVELVDPALWRSNFTSIGRLRSGSLRKILRAKSTLCAGI
ncbi:MAG: JAB domain-containing protein [Butyricicoccus sp.]